MFTDKDFRTQQVRIRKPLKKWLQLMGLLWWQVDIFYDRGTQCKLGEDEGQSCNAHVKTLWEYGKATVTFHLLELESASDEELERIIVHELCHILVNEMRPPLAPNDEVHNEWRKHEERVVSSLTKAFIWTFEGAADSAKCKLQHARKALKPLSKKKHHGA